MGRNLYESSHAVRRVFDQGESIRPGVTQLCFEGPASELNLTVNTQPCLFTVDYGCAIALEETLGEKLCGDHIHGVAGFSLGEVAAATFAGLMDFATGFDFVCQRAVAMHEAGVDNPGVMFAVVKLGANEVEQIAGNVTGVYPVNYNSPAQVVVACQTEQAEKFAQRVAEQGGKALKLPVSGGFHSPLMDLAAEKLADLTCSMNFTEPVIPLYSAMTTQPYDNPQEQLATQVNHPVRWEQTIRTMAADGFDTFIEVGPGRTLSNFIRQIDETLTTFQVNDTESAHQVAAWLKERKGH
jgi:[acyl-carrier-protein] S-malonyltransferase